MLISAKVEATTSSALSTASERTAMLPLRIPTTNLRIISVKFEVNERAAAREARSLRKLSRRTRVKLAMDYEVVSESDSAATRGGAGPARRKQARARQRGDGQDERGVQQQVPALVQPQPDQREVEPQHLEEPGER